MKSFESEMGAGKLGFRAPAVRGSGFIHGLLRNNALELSPKAIDRQPKSLQPLESANLSPKITTQNS